MAPMGPRKPRNARQATAPEVKELRTEALALKEVVAELTLENRLLEKGMIGGALMERQWSERHWRAATYEIPHL